MRMSVLQHLQAKMQAQWPFNTRTELVFLFFFSLSDLVSDYPFTSPLPPLPRSLEHASLPPSPPSRPHPLGADREHEEKSDWPDPGMIDH